MVVVVVVASPCYGVGRIGRINCGCVVGGEVNVVALVVVIVVVVVVLLLLLFQWLW